MKIITTIEATTDAEQAEVAKLLATLTGVTATTTAKPAPKGKETKAATKKPADKPATKAKETKPKAPGLAEVRAALGANVKLKLVEESQQVLSDHGAEKLPDLKKAQYASVISALEALRD